MPRAVRDKNIRLVLAMVEHRHTNRTLGDASGVRADHISKIVNRRVEPKWITRRKIASALGVPEYTIFPKGGV